MSLPHMLYLDEAFAEIKRIDPETAISKNNLRKIVLSGKIRTVQMGQRRLINMDSLYAFLENGDNDEIA